MLLDAYHNGSQPLSLLCLRLLARVLPSLLTGSASADSDAANTNGSSADLMGALANAATRGASLAMRKKKGGGGTVDVRQTVENEWASDEHAAALSGDEEEEAARHGENDDEHEEDHDDDREYDDDAEENDVDYDDDEYDDYDDDYNDDYADDGDDTGSTYGDERRARRQRPKPKQAPATVRRSRKSASRTIASATEPHPWQHDIVSIVTHSLIEALETNAWSLEHIELATCVLLACGQPGLSALVQLLTTRHEQPLISAATERTMLNAICRRSGVLQTHAVAPILVRELGVTHEPRRKHQLALAIGRMYERAAPATPALLDCLIDGSVPRSGTAHCEAKTIYQSIARIIFSLDLDTNQDRGQN